MTTEKQREEIRRKGTILADACLHIIQAAEKLESLDDADDQMLRVIQSCMERLNNALDDLGSIYDTT